jgi:YVTN family beta-propeller protein
VGHTPFGMAALGNRLYVANHDDGTVSVIDLTTNAVIDVDPATAGIQNINVGIGTPEFVEVIGNRVYVSGESGSTVAVIDPATNTLIDTNPAIAGVQNIEAGSGTFQMFAVGNKLYVGNIGDNAVTVIDTTNYTTQTISVPGISTPRGIAVVENKLYVGNTDGTVSVIDLATNTAIDNDPALAGVQPITVPGGGLLKEMAVKGDLIYVTAGDHFTGNQVAVIDTTTNTVVDTITVGNGPWGLTIVGNRLYVANRGSGTVSIIDITPTTL